MTKIGAEYKEDKCGFSIWAPFAKSMEVKITAGNKRYIPMERDDKGYWHAEVSDVKPGDC
jgi:maltooligosyltrehalose trehalohydrolase